MLRLIWIFIFTLALTSCAAIAPAPTPPAAPKATWQERQQALNHLQSWWLNGKIAVQTRNDSGSATVDWTQRLRQYTISIAGPLGSNRLRLAGHPGRVTLQTSDGKTFTAASPEQLLASKWGFQLPVSSMTYWMRGLPVPGLAANTQFDQNNRLTALQQQGFRIDYASYANAGGIDLPQRISFSSPALRMKIIVYQWRVA